MLPETERKRNTEGERAEPQRREVASQEKRQLQSSFIPFLTMWLKPRCESFKLTNQHSTASPTVLKVWQLADPRCHMLAYTHWSQSTISTSVTLGIPNYSFVAEDRFETGKQKSLIISNLTLYYTTYSINALCIMNAKITHKYYKIIKLREGNRFTKIKK